MRAACESHAELSLPRPSIQFRDTFRKSRDLRKKHQTIENDAKLYEINEILEKHETICVLAETAFIAVSRISCLFYTPSLTSKSNQSTSTSEGAEVPHYRETPLPDQMEVASGYACNSPTAFAEVSTQHVNLVT